MILTCDFCGKEFLPGNGPGGIPNGVKLLSGAGQGVTVCRSCIIGLGLIIKGGVKLDERYRKENSVLDPAEDHADLRA